MHQRINEYGYLPFTPNEFFLIFVKKLYGLHIDQNKIEKLEEWYEYLIKNHKKNDDCESFQQGKLAGNNITSRNICYTSKKFVIKKIKIESILFEK